jgi:hypothetical protein
MNIKDKVKNILKKLLSELYTKQDDNLLLLGNLQAREVKRLEHIHSLKEVEFKVFSQWGDDGIIQYLVDKIDIPHKVFVEFGVQDYTESNTRFLLQNDNWSGLVLDGSAEHINYIKSDNIYWRYDLSAKEAFITKDNINELISEYTDIKDIGLLSVDIDGNDYWIWEKIDAVSPQIVVCEYNAKFGNKQAITIPYKSDFYRTAAHSSNLYFGASYQALVSLGKKKGYTLVGCNSAGNNMFFVKDEYAVLFKDIDSSFVDSKFREARDSSGNLITDSQVDITKLIAQEIVYDINSNQEVAIGDLDL